MFHFKVRILSFFTLLSFFPYSLVLAQSNLSSSEQGLALPQKINKQAASEYFASNPSSKVLMPINVFGEVKSPGIYYVPIGSTLMEVIGMAGGPTERAVTSGIKLRSQSFNEEKSVSLYSPQAIQELSAKDTVVVDRSIKADLPLIFGGVSISLSVATFIILLNRK